MSLTTFLKEKSIFYRNCSSSLTDVASGVFQDSVPPCAISAHPLRPHWGQLGSHLLNYEVGTCPIHWIPCAGLQDLPHPHVRNSESRREGHPLTKYLFVLYNAVAFLLPKAIATHPRLWYGVQELKRCNSHPLGINATLESKCQRGIC